MKHGLMLAVLLLAALSPTPLIPPTPPQNQAHEALSQDDRARDLKALQTSLKRTQQRLEELRRQWQRRLEEQRRQGKPRD
jgi:TolA-binding protein